MACVAALSSAIAPAPDFRYVGLEPVAAPRLGVAATAIGFGAGAALAMSGLDVRHALLTGAFASILSAFALRSTGTSAAAVGSTRMAIVPWGVLVETSEAPRIIRWAGVRKVEIETSRARRLFSGSALSSRVIIETAFDRFVGEAVGAVPLERLVAHLDAYANEQSTPVALGLDLDLDLDREGEQSETLEAIEPGCEMLLASARDWLDSGGAVAHLGLPPSGYRRASARTPTSRAVEVLRRVLRDRQSSWADRRPFAAVVAAELHARELLPELIELTQCPHPLLAAVARQSARKLGAPRAKTGTLDEVSPFLFETDRARLEEWAAA